VSETDLGAQHQLTNPSCHPFSCRPHGGPLSPVHARCAPTRASLDSPGRPAYACLDAGLAVIAIAAGTWPSDLEPLTTFRALQCRMLGHAVATAGVFFGLASAIPQTDTAWEVRDLRNKMRVRIHG
jgi:hypothetical protein